MKNVTITDLAHDYKNLLASLNKDLYLTKNGKLIAIISKPTESQKKMFKLYKNNQIYNNKRSNIDVQSDISYIYTDGENDNIGSSQILRDRDTD